MLARGRAVREALKQPQFDPLPASSQVATLVAATAGLFDNMASEQVATASSRLLELLARRLPAVAESIESGRPLSGADRTALVQLAEEAIACKPANPETRHLGH